MTPCPDELELTRAISQGASAEVATHLASCATCRAQRQRLERAIDLARQVDVPMPSAAHREEARTALLAAAFVDTPVRARSSRSKVWLGAAVAAAVAAAVVLVVGTRDSTGEMTTHLHGTLRPRPQTSFFAMSSAPDEIVVLHDGTLDVEVAPLHPGERFRVIVGDAEVEVRGTAFAVTARAGRLIDVVVAHGVVEVRARDEQRMLTAGQSWREPTNIATPSTASAQPTVTNPTATPPVVRHIAKAPPAKADREPAKPQRVPEEVAFDDGWAAMRANRFTQAARAFARVQVLSPTGPLAEDASYWYAVALARAGQPVPAQNAFRDHLDAFPTSRRAGEVSAMLGWLLVEAGEMREAMQRFRAASTDPDAEVRASARAGLEAIAKLTAK